MSNIDLNELLGPGRLEEKEAQIIFSGVDVTTCSTGLKRNLFQDHGR